MTKKSDDEWKAIQQAQADSEREYDRLDTEARIRFNREHRAKMEADRIFFEAQHPDPQLALFDDIK